MIPVPSGVWVRLAVGRTDTRRGMNALALQRLPIEPRGERPLPGALGAIRAGDQPLLAAFCADARRRPVDRCCARIVARRRCRRTVTL
jgi:hypothetical protein